MTLARLKTVARIRIFDRASGRCHLCGLKIHAQRGEKWDIDHVKPLHMGGTNDESNLAPVHKACHAEKSGGENTIRAKTDRQRAKHLGIEKPGPKLPAGRHSDITKTILKGVQPRRSGPQKHRDLMDKLYPWGIPE